MALRRDPTAVRPGPKAAVVAGLFGWVLLCGITLAIAAVAAGWIAIPTSRYA